MDMAHGINSVVQRLRIIIVGAGIGGLAAAYCLGKAGHEIIVVEAAKELGDIGAGIQISSSQYKHGLF